MKMFPPLRSAPHRLLMTGALVVSMINSGMAAGNPQRRVITLEEAYDRTLASDQAVRTAYIEIRKANLLPWSALTKISPQLTGGLTLRHSDTHTAALFETPASLSAVTSKSANCTLQQTLVDFTFFPAYRLAKLTGITSRLQYRFTLRNVLFGVAKAYYEVLKQEKIVVQDNETLDFAERQLQLSQNQYNVGAVARVDVLRGQSTLESARQALISDQNTLALDRNVLANTLNLRPQMRDFELIQPDDAVEVPHPLGDDLAQAYLHREDYKISAIGIDQNVELRNAVLGEYAPTVTAQVSQDWAAETPFPHSSSGSALDAALSVNVPIFTGGQREIDLQNAGHNIQEAKIALETTTKTVETDVQATWLQVATLRETIESLKSQVIADDQNYKDLLNQYQAGAATSLDTQTGLIQLVTSKTNLIAQTYEFQVALRDLQRSVAAFQNKRVLNVSLP